MPFVYDGNQEYNIGKYYSSMLTIAYLSNIRRHVVERNFTFLANFQGKHRSTKSTTATLFGYLLDPTFWKYFEQRFVSSPAGFMEAVDNATKTGKKGCVILVDEAGNSMSSSDYYENFLKTISKVTMMMGYLNLIVLYCGIYRTFVDSRIRKMFHTYYDVNRFNNEYSIVKPYLLKYNSMQKKEYQKFPIVHFLGDKVTLERIKVYKPPAFLTERYDNVADIRKNDMLEGYNKDIKKEEVRNTREAIDLDKLTEFVVTNYRNFESPKSKEDKTVLDILRIEFGCKVPAKVAKHLKMEGERMIALKKANINENTERDNRIAAKETISKPAYFAKKSWHGKPFAEQREDAERQQ